MMAIQLSDDRISKTQRRNQLIDGLHDLPSQIRNVLQLDRTLQQLAASTLRNAQSLLIMGRGFQYSTCLEAALKIKELAYIHSEVRRSDVWSLIADDRRASWPASSSMAHWR
jgi:glucosamine--fructose-6-phosphate aminotransferase (isomerizing)